MIPRKEAKRLLEEFLVRIEEAEAGVGDPLDSADLRHVEEELLRESDLVLRGAENVEQKGRRYLTEGRVTVTSATEPDGLIVAEARGTDGLYHLGYDPKKRQWRCTCPSGRGGRCSHVTALKLVTDTTTRGAST